MYTCPHTCIYCVNCILYSNIQSKPDNHISHKWNNNNNYYYYCHSLWDLFKTTVAVLIFKFIILIYCFPDSFLIVLIVHFTHLHIHIEDKVSLCLWSNMWLLIIQLLLFYRRFSCKNLFFFFFQQQQKKEHLSRNLIWICTTVYLLFLWSWIIPTMTKSHRKRRTRNTAQKVRWLCIFTPLRRLWHSST